MVEEFICKAPELECKRTSKIHMLAAYTATVRTLPTNATIIPDPYKVFLKTNLGAATQYAQDSMEVTAECYDPDASVTSLCLVLFQLCPLLSCNLIKRSFCFPF